MSRTGRLLYHLCHLLLGAVFLYAGWVKAADVTVFAGQVAAYRILPYAGNVLTAAILPYIEILTGVLLLTGRRVRAASLLAFLLTLLFMTVLAAAVARGLDIDCGCFRPGEKSSPLLALGRDAALLVLAAATFFLRGRLVR